MIGVGAPSYTSGAHMWNGTAAILNAMPATTRMTASVSQRPRVRASASAIGDARAACVVPGSAYSSDMP